MRIIKPIRRLTLSLLWPNCLLVKELFFNMQNSKNSQSVYPAILYFKQYSKVVKRSLSKKIKFLFISRKYHFFGLHILSMLPALSNIIRKKMTQVRYWYHFSLTFSLPFVGEFRNLLKQRQYGFNLRFSIASRERHLTEQVFRHTRTYVINRVVKILLMAKLVSGFPPGSCVSVYPGSRGSLQIFPAVRSGGGFVPFQSAGC